ncbi:MAG: DEAD/DEAH box helicase family protein [Oscillospiraceae bacterium]|nr:DEAD/DEAH box helicase family protein [Oscillospiraceae bacterium]
MELKTYQKNVIGDLARFLSLLTEKGSASKAYNALWEEKNVNVGMGGLPYYHYNLQGGVPDVCFKVPTGGGKTFIAASSIKAIYDAMPTVTAKAVVWLVPSDAILTQTYAALSNPHHPYRQKIDVDFGGAVEVYSKAQLLNGQNFNPTAVTEQLSIFVLSYDSFRTSKKEGRKAYQENGNLATFPKLMQDKSMLLPDTDETALIQVIRSLNPVVIVDESHHATSALSVEMLENFNPCFVLDLTATPKKNSNIISFVDAMQLKKANMVKLPVIVYNRKSQDDVYADAISIRRKLEIQAQNEQKTSGRYIRPIVLFQAQPRVGAESTTYDKIKATLVEAGIPKEEIAIKTGDKDELKNIDLLSPDCPIRYIITVNALKEGWDCPFAYVLATVANRTSSVDVEQILGRVLRLPYTQKNASDVLNISYVITSSADFGKTLDRVVSGLNHAGFTDKDYRAKDVEAEQEKPTLPEPVQMVMQPQEEPEVPEVNTSDLRHRIEQAMQQDDTAPTETIESDELLSAALAQNEEYEEKVNTSTETVIDLAPTEVRDKMNSFRINDAFVEEASALRFPQFMMEVGPSFFSDNEFIPLKLEHLEDGFTLRDKDVRIDFSTVDAEMARVDTDDSANAVPKVWQIKGTDSTYYKEWFNAQPSNIRLAHCKGLIQSRISKMNCVNDKELRDYIDRIVETMTEDQLSDMEQSTYPYIIKVEKKVKDLLAAHRSNVFDLWLEQGKITCKPNYALSPVISPTNFFSTYPKSLYSSEEDVNEYERKMVWALSSMDNIKWWHRNISRLGFQINGAIHAYPDIIAMTTSGKILMIETKGDHLDNDESKAKAKIGHQWDNLAGPMYRYFMVFQSKILDWPGAYSYDRFMEIVKGL